ncbi:hypothetical protein IJ707_02575 [bacterium]|nr:hypothetical protein [bacterium]
MEKKKLIIIISSIVAIILILTVVMIFVNKDNNNSAKIKHYIETQVTTSMAEAQSLDNSKPMVIVFHAPYCSTCHQFMPAFNKLAKDYAKDFNFVALNIQEPQNYPLVAGNVGGIPSLYIFDTSIGNKVHISLSAIRSYNELKAELDRYLRIRSYIDLEKAKADHEKLVEKYLKDIKKNAKQNN